MVPAKEMGELLGLTYTAEDDGVGIGQDRITVKVKYNTPYVYKDDYILYVLEGPAVEIKGLTYVPLQFFSGYLKAKVEIDKHNLFKISDQELSLYNVVKFLPKEVLGALNDKNYPYRDKILKAVELPTSMDIKTPKLNNERIIDTTLLVTLDPIFKDELIQHGYKSEEIVKFSLEDYNAIESTWKLSEEMLRLAIISYPELINKDLSSWTYGDLRDYSLYKDKIDLESRFTEEEKKQFSERGILLEDTFYLLKEFHNVDTILSQPNQVLKKTIEAYYQFAINRLEQN